MGHRFLTDPVKYPMLADILNIHAPGADGNYFHEAKTPFYLTLMSVRAEHPERNTLSIFAPGRQLCLPPLGRSQAGPDGELALHHHNSYEITYIIEGSMYQVVEGRRYYYPAGSCCLMNRGTLHTEEDGTDYTCVFLSFTDEFVRRLAYYGNSFLFLGEQETLQNPVFRFLTAGREGPGEKLRGFLDFVPKITQREQEVLVHRLFEQMLRTLIDPGVGDTYQLLALLLRLLATLGDEQYYHLAQVTAESNLEQLLMSRVDRILDQRHGRISNRELAELLHYNGSYLGRIIKKHTGQSLFDYSMTFAMAYAAEALRSTDKTAAAIAAELRFTNHTHFYRVFRDHFGLTPNEYRKTIQLSSR